MFNKLKSFFLKKSIRKLYRFKTTTTQAGQGIIEYLLILILTITIIIGLARGVGGPLVNNIRENVFNMVGCMLRLGEGPARAFQLCGGSDALQLDLDAIGSSGTTGGTAGNSGDTDSNNSNSSNDSSNNDDTTGGGSSSSNQTNVREPTGRDSLDGSGGSRGRGGAIAGSEFGGEGTQPAESNRIKLNDSAAGEDDSFNYSGLNQDTVVVRRIRRSGEGQVAGGFTLVGREEAVNSGEEQMSTPATIKKKAPKESDMGKRRVSSFAITDSRENSGDLTNTDMDNDFSFMKMIKWIVIIGIIFIFGVFTASQLNSIRKGWTE